MSLFSVVVYTEELSFVRRLFGIVSCVACPALTVARLGLLHMRVSDFYRNVYIHIASDHDIWKAVTIYSNDDMEKALISAELNVMLDMAKARGTPGKCLEEMARQGARTVSDRYSPVFESLSKKTWVIDAIYSGMVRAIVETLGRHLIIADTETARALRSGLSIPVNGAAREIAREAYEHALTELRHKIEFEPEAVRAFLEKLVPEEWFRLF